MQIINKPIVLHSREVKDSKNYKLCEECDGIGWIADDDYTHIATINKVKIIIYNNAVHMIAFTLLIYCSSSFNFWYKRVDLSAY